MIWSVTSAGTTAPKRRHALFAAAIALLVIMTGVSAAGPARASLTPHAAVVSPFGPNVHVFTPDMPQSEIQASVDSIAAQQIPNQFGTQRYSLLFAPGTYGSAANPLIFQVGYYTEVAGLGASPDDVTINGSINVFNQCTTDANGTSCVALNNFWRSLSNLAIHLTGSADCRATADFWAVSQAAPMRRVDFSGGNLSLMDYCTAGPQFASGGFISDSSFAGGTVINGSQQQFVVRNSNLDGWSNGVWNQVFSGDNGAPPQSFSETSGLPDGTPPYTTLGASPVTQEKPFVYLDATGSYRVFVPSVRHDSVGPDWSDGTSLPVDDFYIATPTSGDKAINAALAAGLNLIFTPGVYNLRRTIAVQRAHTIVLGMGFATLVPQQGTRALTVADVPGVKISGLIVDAGERSSDTLVSVGTCGGQRPCDAGDPADPTVLQDVFFRIGGATPGKARTSLVVGNSNTILDDLWAWRADHGAGVGWTKNTANTGLVVNGDDVTAYGLFVEHYQKTEVIWNGRRGTDIFFQNEMPYDPPSQAAWQSSASSLGYPAFLITSQAKGFQGYGMASYCFFNQGVEIHSSTAFAVAHGSGTRLHDLLTRFLNASGGIDHVVNTTGAPVTTDARGPSDVVTYP